MATGVYGTIFKSDQTDIQRRLNGRRHGGNAGVGRNLSALFPNSPIDTGVEAGDSNRGNLSAFSSPAELRQSFARVVDSDNVTGGFGFADVETVNLNYSAEGRPNISEEGIVEGELGAPIGAPSLLTPEINSPTDNEFVLEPVVPERKGRGFGINVSQQAIGPGSAIADTIGKYFTSINSAGDA